MNSLNKTNHINFINAFIERPPKSANDSSFRKLIPTVETEYNIIVIIMNWWY